MSKEKLETGAMLHPACQKCSKKDTCDNKRLCAYLIPKINETKDMSIYLPQLTLYETIAKSAGISYGGRK